jgi:predicted ATP-grasp superfamily ATP-dependent carboligase
MKRVLVTGARAPAALELIRGFSNSGLEVYSADSIHHPLSRASRHLTKYFVISSPSNNTKAFIEGLENIITKYQIDVLVPTCEEVFFISKHKKHLEKNCVVFCDNFEKLSILHNKYKFMQSAGNCGAFIPNTKLICNHSELIEIKNNLHHVFKPVFSRFASHTLICPSEVELKKIIVNEARPWVAQEYILGAEFCTYGIAVMGKLLVHTCYQPIYRAGLGSGIYFAPIFKENIYNFVRNFVSKHNFTGQIGFDFILTKNNALYVLECNPRATSGIHCLPSDIDWMGIMTGQLKISPTISKEPKMVVLAMLTFGLKYLLTAQAFPFIQSIMRAKDVVWKAKDIKPSFYQIISLSEIILKAFRFRISPKEAATADIEWNGGEID